MKHHAGLLAAKFSEALAQAMVTSASPPSAPAVSSPPPPPPHPPRATSIPSAGANDMDDSEGDLPDEFVEGRAVKAKASSAANEASAAISKAKGVLTAVSGGRGSRS